MEKLVFVVDDESSVLKLVSHWVKQWGYNVKTFTNGGEALDCLNEDPDLVLLDIMLPDIDGNEVLRRIRKRNENLPVIMLSAQGSVEVAIESIHLGAFDYFTKPIDSNRLKVAIKNSIQTYDLHRKITRLQEDLEHEFSFDEIITADKKMQEMFKFITKVLNNDITVLIHGESGTGKELVARAIHYNGTRKDAPFVVVNCASIPRELLESELFGHEKGSFTGAYNKKIGKFELAKEGTLFLDEIGEMEMSLQAKILRVIQEKEFERVGGNEVIKTNVRILSATNRDLKDAVDNKEFREDLYYRLNSFPITIPPLRERRGDIVVLINYFIKEFNEKLGKEVEGITKNALGVLYDYDWPGNVRELENTIERCMILTDGSMIDKGVLPKQMLKNNGNTLMPSNTQMFEENSPIVPIEKLKEEAIKHALKVTEGNIVEASKRLQVGRATLYRLMDKYDINYKK